MNPDLVGFDGNTIPSVPGGIFDVSSLNLTLILTWVVVALVLIGAAWFAVRMLRANLRRQAATFKAVTLLITIPKFQGGEKEGQGAPTKERVQEAIAASESLFATLGGVKSEHGFHSWLHGRSDEMAFEIVFQKKVILFYVTVPKSQQTFVEQSISASWSDASIEPVEDYNIFTPNGVVLGSFLKLKRPNAFPIKTYRKLDKDPLDTLTNSIAKLGEDDGAAYQFLVRPAQDGWRKRGMKIATNMKQGMTMEEALSGHKKSKAGLAELSGLKTAKEEKPEHRLGPQEEKTVEGLEEKASKAGLEVCIRLIAASPTAERAETALSNMLNAFGQYSIYEYGNSFTKSVPRNKNVLINGFVQREFDEHHVAILNAEELASLWHLPTVWSETPNIRWLGARRAPAPPNTPDASTGDVQLGENIFRGATVPVWMKKADRRRHMYVIGKSGTGKTEMMKAMVQQDIENGYGVCVIDPHGDFADDALSFVPKERADDVIFFDPADYERPMGLNMLEFDPTHPEQKTFVINEMLKIFDKLYDLKSTGGPMFELYMRNAMLLLMEDVESGSTLMEISKVLSDDDYRNYKLSKCKSLDVKNFWQKEALKAGGEASLANMVPYITSKLTPFIYNDYMRPIIGQQKSAFNMREAMDSQKIILLKLSKGKIGDLNAYLIGMVLVGKILMSALSRSDIADPALRKDFYLYIDEFQNFLTDSISAILSEARKYGLDLIVAHQFIGQLEGKGGDNAIKDAIFGNVGSILINRIGVEDAEFLAKEMAPVFTEYDLVNVEAMTFNAKILIDNGASKPFTLKPLRPRNPKTKELAENIRELSRLRFGRDRELVEAEILERAQSAIYAGEKMAAPEGEK